jgi:hypothetical protein
LDNTTRQNASVVRVWRAKVGESSSSVAKRHHILVIKYCCHNVRFIIQSDDFEIFEMWNLVKNRGQSFDNRLLVVHNVEEESSFDVYRSSSSPALDWGLIDNDSKDMQR